MEKDTDIIQSIGHDFKMSIDGLIYHIKTIKEDVESIQINKKQ